MNVQGRILLAIWLIAVGLIPLLSISFAGRDNIVGVVAIVAGALILWEGRLISINANLEMVLLGAWLIATGCLALFQIEFQGRIEVMAVLAIVTGVIILQRGSRKR